MNFRTETVKLFDVHSARSNTESVHYSIKYIITDPRNHMYEIKITRNEAGTTTNIQHSYISPKILSNFLFRKALGSCRFLIHNRTGKSSKYPTNVMSVTDSFSLTARFLLPT